MYGKMPGEFSDYWTRRFPRLVSHAYLSMQCVKYENNFSRYYHKDYDYVPVSFSQFGRFKTSKIFNISTVHTGL